LRRTLLALVLAAALIAGGWVLVRRGAAPPASQATSLILLTIDTLRADRLDSRRMPALSAFAAEGLRFDQARTTAPLTLPSHASLMTGLLPPVHGARENGQTVGGAHQTLARALRAGGFRTGAFVSAFVLDRQFGLSDGFEVYDDRVARDPDAALRLEAERDGSDTIAAALQWLGTIDPSRERFFLWVHLFEPHAPYAPSRSCGAAREPHGDAGEGAYDRDVLCADTLAGRLIDALSRMPRAASTAWVIAGDHGEALGEHGETTHGMLLYDATLRVPLILRGPGAPAAALEAPVSLVDVAPTAMRWLGVTPPAAMNGIDLLASPGAERDVYS
jgi:choline-sulfatase